MADPRPADSPAQIRTERLTLRSPEGRDRAAVIDLFASPEVGTYIGGPRPRDELEREVPDVPRGRFGLFVVDLAGAMIGLITLDRRPAERPGHIRSDDEGRELGYMFLPEAWGCGYAAEACEAALGWFAGAFPGEPVMLCTQTANERSMRLATKLGFTERERFEEFGAEQWLGVLSSAAPIRREDDRELFLLLCRGLVEAHCSQVDFDGARFGVLASVVPSRKAGPRIVLDFTESEFERAVVVTEESAESLWPERPRRWRAVQLMLVHADEQMATTGGTPDTYALTLPDGYVTVRPWGAESIASVAAAAEKAALERERVRRIVDEGTKTHHIFEWR